jgi:hypothetical protein
MAGERLPARFSLRSLVRQWRTGKCFETATSHMQTVHGFIKKTNKTPKTEIKKAEEIRKEYFERKTEKNEKR